MFKNLSEEVKVSIWGMIALVVGLITFIWVLSYFIDKKQNTNMNKDLYNNVLVVVDCQNDFITGSLANTEAQRKVPNIVKKIRGFKGDAIYVTLDTHYSDYLETKEGKALPVVHCIENTEGWELDPNISAALNDASLRGIPVVYIKKNTFGSRELGIRVTQHAALNSKIELIGLDTDICVLSNAILLKTQLYNISDISVDASCCAGVTVDTHKAALTTMKQCQITITNPED